MAKQLSLEFIKDAQEKLKAKGISRADFAHRNLISPLTLNRFLSGNTVRKDVFEKICSALDLDVELVSASAEQTIIDASSRIVANALEDLQETAPDDVQKIASAQIKLLYAYYSTVLTQAQRSFRWALIAAIAGFSFFVVSVSTLTLKNPKPNLAWISLLSGAIVEVIAGLNFYLYGKTSSQMAKFQERLDGTQRYLLANSLCERLEGEHKHQARTELIRAVAKISTSTEKASKG